MTDVRLKAFVTHRWSLYSFHFNITLSKARVINGMPIRCNVGIWKMLITLQSHVIVTITMKTREFMEITLHKFITYKILLRPKWQMSNEIPQYFRMPDLRQAASTFLQPAGAADVPSHLFDRIKVPYLPQKRAAVSTRQSLKEQQLINTIHIRLHFQKLPSTWRY